MSESNVIPVDVYYTPLVCDEMNKLLLLAQGIGLPLSHYDLHAALFKGIISWLTVPRMVSCSQDVSTTSL